MSENGTGMLRITLVRSTIGRPADQGRTVAALGLRRLNATVERPDNPSIRGMVTKIRHLVRVEEVPAASTAGSRRRTSGGARVEDDATDTE
jgi:large subunit ribosomal protein L30